MAGKLYLIKEGEISLKGGNRNLFEKQLRHNIKNKLRPYHSDFSCFGALGTISQRMM